MTDNQHGESGPTGQNDSEIERNWRQLREQADAGKQAAARAEQLAQENALLKAGVPLDTPLGQLFQNGYKGEWDDPSKVKEAWQAIAPTAPPQAPTPPEQQQQVADPLAALSAMQQASAGGTPPVPEGLDARLAQAKSQDEIVAILRATDPRLVAE